ncbi:MAG: NAD(P)-dependent oxidoreductase [Bacteroidetes bacterium]|nr:NAD(P)-dependent oxidoreductase [Bacteroidota bacterium]
MKGFKNLVLGGSGMIGGHLCTHLESLGENVINLDLKEGFDLRIDDLSSYQDVDYVWFLAWDVGGSKYLQNKDNALELLNNNTLLCYRTFAFLQDSKLPFLFTSSQLAAPDNVYGITKLMGEQWTELLKGVTVKLWNVYGWEGPGERSHVIPDMILSSLEKGSIELYTSGDESRQFIHVNDCVKNLVEVRDNMQGIKELHLSNGQWISIAQLAQKIGAKLSVPVNMGNSKGYNNLIDPNDTYKEFSFDIELDEGLELVIKDAKRWISEKPAS